MIHKASEKCVYSKWKVCNDWHKEMKSLDVSFYRIYALYIFTDKGKSRGYAGVVE